MKVFITLIPFLLFTFSCGDTTQKSDQKNEQEALPEIMQVMRQFAVAFQRRDFKMMDRLLDDGYRLNFPDGKIINKQELLKHIKDESAKFELKEYEVASFRRVGDVGVLVGYVDAEITILGRSANGWHLGILILKKEDGIWKPFDEYFSETDYRPPVDKQ
jgi:ketosteroid isomerase-like protein